MSVNYTNENKSFLISHTGAHIDGDSDTLNARLWLGADVMAIDIYADEAFE